MPSLSRPPRSSGFIAAGLIAACLAAAPAHAASRRLPRSTPEEQGIRSAAILAFVEAADAEVSSMHSFMMLRHGKVVAEAFWDPYTSEDPHVLYSLSKSFTSTAVGLAVAEGKLSVDDRVVSFFPDLLPPSPSDNLKAMRVRDLLAMSTGHHNDALQAFDFSSKESVTKAFLALPVAHKPGTHFVYNTPATYMASAIVQKVTGQTVLDYLRPRLFEPLGIEKATWEATAQGVSMGGFGLSVRTEDIASFAQLYLQKGQWQGRQLLPASWVEMATARQTSNGSDPSSDWDQGYGYQFWRCRNGAYRGDGAFGQYAIVMPEQDAVIAITSATRNMQAVMNLVWDKLLPAFEAAPLPADGATQGKLLARTSSLRVAPPTGLATSPQAARVSGKTFAFPANPLVEAVTPSFGKDGARFVVRTAGWREYLVMAPTGRWNRTNTFPFGGTDSRTAASGAWTSPDTYRLALCNVESPHCVTADFRFAGLEVTVDAEQNVAFGETKMPTMKGQVETKPKP